MLPKYTTTNLTMNVCKLLCINLINILGAFVGPNDMTNHSYKPYLALKVIFHSSPSFILILWYQLFKSILEKIHATYNSFNMSSSLGIRCLYFTVMLLMVRQSIHILQVLSFLDISITSIIQGLILSWMYPLLLAHLFTFEALSSP
jgi:hypothetical protein